MCLLTLLTSIDEILRLYNTFLTVFRIQIILFETFQLIKNHKKNIMILVLRKCVKSVSYLEKAKI